LKKYEKITDRPNNTLIQRAAVFQLLTQFGDILVSTVGLLKTQCSMMSLLTVHFLA